MTKKLLPIYAVGKILKENGGLRASNMAKKALKSELEEYALNLSKKAVSYASHAKRRTVKASDIKLASKN